MPPTPHRRELRDLPSPAEMRFANRDEMYSTFDDIDIRPLPGGCLVSFGPGQRRRR